MIISGLSARRLASALLLCLLCSFGGVAHVSAAAYGRGGYNACGYQACPHPTPTTVTTGGNLEVSINLSNGQVIPHDGYYVTVTPLNGQGSSFAKAEFYVNGALAYSAVPDETGTVRWLWKPGALNKADLKIVITDQQGNTTTKTFSVTVEGVQQVTPAAGANSDMPKSGISGVIQQAYQGAKKAINSLPPPVVYSFPYILYILLAANVLLLLLQAKRELREYQISRALLTRAQAVNEGKQTLTQLVSHYLRTPLTVIAGGVEMLQREPGASAESRAKLQDVVARIQSKIDHLISQTEAVQPVATAASPQSLHLWRRPALFLPLLLIAAIALPFNYLAAHAEKFSISQVNLTAQIIIFVILALATLQVFRRLQLHKRDTRELNQLANAIKADIDARDKLITDTVDVLNQDLQTTEKLSDSLPASRAGNFVRDGQKRLRQVLGTFAVARRLRGGHAKGIARPVALQPLVAQAQQSLASAQDTSRITIQVQSDVQVRVAQPELLVTVLASLLDNALAYSEASSTVTIRAEARLNDTVISITDHGQGIAADKLPLLLQPFSKAEGALTFTHEGMGFSLYLDKLILTYLGGSITLESALGRGTTATLRLPK